MSITLYSKYRRQNLRRAWHFSGMSRTITEVAAGLIILLIVYGIAAWSDAHADQVAASARNHATQAEAKAHKAYRLLSDCLNGRAIRVSGTNDAIFCGRASYQKGL